MKQKVIWAIIVIMTVSVLGVSMIQLFWIKWSVNLDEKNFNDKVIIALNRVKHRLLQDAASTFYESISYENFPIGTNILDLEDPYLLLESINKDRLDTYLKTELLEQGIELQYEYGIYSAELQAFIIVNGNYSVPLNNTKASNVASPDPLTKAEFKIALFSDGFLEPGYLKLNFPEKTKFIWSSVLPILVSSIIFTFLILACFVYTVFVVFRQKKVSEMKTDFINNMTHEFKTPIATISLASDSILNPNILEQKEKISRFIHIIKQENARMLKQVEKVLQVAQIDKGSVVLKQSEIDLAELIENAIINAELKVQAKGGHITFNAESKNHVIVADGAHISNVINNLLDNAEKYTPQSPNIFITTKDVRDMIEISIQDNGLGMTKDSIKHIFEKFYRVHTGNVHDVKGFGLGLSYVKAIVDAHKGKISVKSEIGKGSTFIITLPRRGKTKSM